MSFDGSGTYNRVPGSAYTNGTTNDGSELDAEMNDLATALSLCLPRDGQAAATGNLPMGGYKLTGAGAGSSNQDSIIYAQAVGFGILPNLSLTATVGSSALTIAVKGRDGNDPSATNPITVPFRSATATAGTWTAVSITSALSVVVSSGSKLGHVDARPGIIFLYIINNAGTAELSVASRFYGWSGIVSTTAEGGAGAADAGDTMYSTTARTSVAFVCIGYAISTQTTAGTWAAVPTTIKLAPFTMPSTMFRVHRNGTNQTAIATGGTGAAFDATTADYDPLGVYDLTNNYFVAPMAGVYEFFFQSARVNPTDQTYQQFSIRKDTGAGFNIAVTSLDVHASTSGGALDITNVSARLWLAAGTKIDAHIQHSRGTNEDFSGSVSVSYFEGAWIGDIVS